MSTDLSITLSPGSTPAPSRKFADEYRPRTFEDVRGQPHPVRFLSGLIKNGQAARPLLLHGAIGSGKTSLVRIYARALNCLCPTPEGSPCLTCRPCLTGAGFHEYDTSGSGGTREAVLEWMSTRNHTPRDHRFNVLFFDEAQSLEPGAADALLKNVEEPKDGVTFCFATTEFGKIRPALRSRLMAFEIKPLSANDANALLKACADAEGITYEPGALELLAGLRQGYARDLVTGLEQVADLQAGPVTVARVREVFDVDHTQWLLAYAYALAQGDPAGQHEAWFDWHETAATKIDWLQALLTGLYYNDVLGQALVVDALIASILAPDRAPILTAFQHRLGLTEATELAPYWQAMMAFWTMPAVDLSETALQLRIALFHDFVNRALPKLAVSPETDACLNGTSPARSIAPTHTHASNLGPNGSLIGRFGEQRCPTILNVYGIIESASYLMQEHGLLFNACVLLQPALLGVDQEEKAVALIAAFCEALRAEVESWSQGPFARLCLIERDTEAGGEVQARILVHLPEPDEPHHGVDAAARLIKWSRSWQRELGFESSEAVILRTQAVAKARPLQFHWDGVLDLCAGLPDDTMAWDPVSAREQPLLDLLGVSQARLVGSIGAPLVDRSELLAAKAVARACENGMSFLSALTAKQWGLLRKGWELDEYKERQRTKTKRQRDLDDIVVAFGDTEEARIRRDRLMAGWQARPEDREREVWRGWWLPAEV